MFVERWVEGELLLGEKKMTESWSPQNSEMRAVDAQISRQIPYGKLRIWGHIKFKKIRVSHRLSDYSMTDHHFEKYPFSIILRKILILDTKICQPSSGLRVRLCHDESIRHPVISV